MKFKALLGSVQAVIVSCAISLSAWADDVQPLSVETLPKLKGSITLYLGRGEGGLYENVLDAIKKRNPDLQLHIRRGPTAALANAIVAERQAGIHKADLFWAVDSAAIAMLEQKNLAQTIQPEINALLSQGFRYKHWVPVTGRIRTLPYHSQQLNAADIPDSILALADSDLSIGWAPAYSSFQSFVTAMRLQYGDDKTLEWLRKIKPKAKSYAGELGVAMAVERGEVDVGFANHYYTLRLKSGKKDAKINLAFTQHDAGSLLNVSAISPLSDKPVVQQFIQYLLTQEVQSYLAQEAYEIPMVKGVNMPPGLPSMADLAPPKTDLTKLADFQPTLQLMRKAGIL